MNTCDGLINSIKYWYFLNEDEKRSEYSIYLNPEFKEEKIDFRFLAEQSLKKHSLFNFKI